MRELLRDLVPWWRSGLPIGLATVVATSGSAPRGPGAAMAVGPGGAVLGSVSGGCVEAEVYALCEAVALDGGPRVESYEVSDETAFGTGLMCGGTLEVFAERVDAGSFPELGALADDVAADRAAAVAVVINRGDGRGPGARLVIRDGETSGDLGSAGLNGAVVADAGELLAASGTAVRSYPVDGQWPGADARVLIQTFAPRPRLLVFGAIDFAAAVARAGALLGYRVTVCDARPVFATARRFPAAEEVVVDWPHRYLAAEAAAGRVDGRTAVCVLTHDVKFDVPLLRVALGLPAVGYVGAMGSRRTHTERTEALRAAGVSAPELARLRSPIGLDLGARTPEETAISIVAEMVADRYGGTGRRLSQTSGRIHQSGESTSIPVARSSQATSTTQCRVR